MMTKFERLRQTDRIAVRDSYLTPREYQCVSMYIDGSKKSEMPKLLGCSPKTIEAHTTVAKNRLRARTLSQLIAWVAAADALRELDRYSNRDNLGQSMTTSEPNASVSLAGIGPGAAPRRAL